MRRKDFSEKLTNMHAENLSCMNQKKEVEKKMESDIDRMAIDNGLRMADNHILKRTKEILQ